MLCPITLEDAPGREGGGGISHMHWIQVCAAVCMVFYWTEMWNTFSTHLTVPFLFASLLVLDVLYHPL